MAPRTRIMYIENKSEGIVGPARIGKVTFSKTGKSVYYGGHLFLPLKGFKANYADSETHAEYWISGCKKDGTDALYSTTVTIDEDVREEYWTQNRRKPEMKHVKSFKCPGKYAK